MYRFGTAAIMLAASTRRIDPPAGRYAAGFSSSRIHSAINP